MPRVPNLLPLDQRCTRCKSGKRELGRSSCQPCRVKRQKKMQELRAAVKAAIAKEKAGLDDLTNAQSGYPDAQSGQDAQPHNRSDKSNERSNGENVPAADALMGVFGMARESHGQERIPVQEKAPEDCSPRAAHQVVPDSRLRQTQNHTEAHSEQAPKLFRGTDVQSGGLILVVPDLHAPLHDRRAVGAVWSLMESHTFSEVIFLGDEAELVSLSWFGGPDSMKRYRDEALEVRATLMEFRRRHQGRMTSTVGNHTARIESAVERTKPQLAGSIKDEIGYDSLGIEVIPEDKVLLRGKIKFVHGHQSMGGKNIPTYHARLMADLYGTPNGAVVYGHTHRSQTFVRRMDEGPTTAYGLGCLEQRPRWMKGVCGWTQEVAVCEPSAGYVEPLRIIDGALWYGGRCYRG